MIQARVGTPRLRRVRSPRAATPLRRAFRRCRRQFLTAWRRVTWQARLAIAAVSLIALWAPLNLAYQLIEKPTELFAPLGTWLTKTPDETWRSYAPLFRRYATDSVSPELLAALAQTESAGNPVATTYWRWRLTFNPLGIYRPASSAVGLYQMTDAAYATARRFCVTHHRVTADRRDTDVPACGQDGAYWRILPSDAVELSAAYLDRNLAALLPKRRASPTAPQQRDRLAAVIHLCGPGPAAAYVERGFRVAPGEHCGDQDVAAYVARVAAFARQFHALAQADANAS